MSHHQHRKNRSHRGCVGDFVGKLDDDSGMLGLAESARPYQVALWIDIEDTSIRKGSPASEFENDLLQSIARVLGEAWNVVVLPCPALCA